MFDVRPSPQQRTFTSQKDTVTGRPTSIENRLLAALPPADLGLLTPHFQKVSFEPDAVSVRSGAYRLARERGAIPFMSLGYVHRERAVTQHLNADSAPQIT
jgi:hypothetical protein